MMAVEILQHQITGEYYIAQYADGMTLEQLSRIAGPVSLEDAYTALTDGDTPDGDPDEIEWAKKQPWTARTSAELEERLHIND